MENRQNVSNIRAMLQEDFPEAISHAMCVSNMAYLLARQLQLEDDECQEIALAGMVHDIGKIKLAGYLYGRKDDALTIEETKYIRMHSELGYEILKEQDFSKYVLNTVLYHHENFDGSGYPANLSGKNIPKGARIMRVSDVFIALISNRPYRAAFDVDTAIELMIEEVKNYDMEVFLAFMTVVHTMDMKKITDLFEVSKEERWVI